jgi:hypothetical protein
MRVYYTFINQPITQIPRFLVSDYIEIPKALTQSNQNVTICIDGMKVNGIPFLTTVSRHLMYRTAEWIPNQTSDAYKSVLQNVLRVYDKAGFRVKTILCDSEFRPLTKRLADMLVLKSRPYYVIVNLDH